MSRNKYPKPHLKTVLLVSDGLQEPTVTLHHYHETRVTSQFTPYKLDGTTPDPDPTAFEFMYRCSKTGAVRRFGLINVDEHWVN